MPASPPTFVSGSTVTTGAGSDEGNMIDPGPGAGSGGELPGGGMTAPIACERAPPVSNDGRRSAGLLSSNDGRRSGGGVGRESNDGRRSGAGGGPRPSNEGR